MSSGSRRTRGYRVGITIFVGKGGELGLHENGMRQNVVFLYQLFRAAPNCAEVWLLNYGDGEFAGWPPGLGLDDVPVVRTAELAGALDHLIVIGAAVDPGELRHLRERGVRVIAYKGGNAAIISMEATIARPPRADAERYGDCGLYDAIWMTPQHVATYAGWCRTVYRAPVYEVPQIWAPTFVEARARLLDGRFGYRPGRSRWRVGIMEPNITVMKTAHVPMLACEAAWRARPDAIAAVWVTNAQRHRDQPHLSSFANGLSIVRAGVMSFEPRFVSTDFLANHCDAVVTHQWENGLNYLYYEVLHGGYPLIHNSPILRDHGYYFADFSAADGGHALLQAFDHHDSCLASYMANVAGLIAQLSPVRRDSVELHERLLIG